MSSIRMSSDTRDALARVLAAVRGARVREEALQPHGGLIDTAFQAWLQSVRAGQDAESEAYLALFDELLPDSPNVLGLGMAMACRKAKSASLSRRDFSSSDLAFRDRQA